MNNLFKKRFANVHKTVAHGIVCMLLFAAVSCGDSKELPDIPEPDEKVSFTEFSLIGTACKWVRYGYAVFGYELIIINSNEALRNYINCTEVGDFPTIDFSRYTLLLARGFWGNQCTPDSVKLQRLSPGNYELNIDFPPQSLIGVTRHWHVAIITDKLNDSDTVKLNVTYAVGTTCKWIRYNGDSGYELIIINSDEELRNYITCAEADDFPTFDFSRYTLLLARGFWGNQCTPHFVELQQLSPGNYELNLYFNPSLLGFIRHWHVAIITDKLNDSDTVKLNVIWGRPPLRHTPCDCDDPLQEATHYYWFRGERIPLTVNTNCVHVIVNDGFHEFANSSSWFQIVWDNSDEGCLVKLRLRPEGRPRLTLSEYLETVDALRQSGTVSYVFPFFERGDGAPSIGTSDVFYLRLREVGDITKLREVANRHNVQIVRQVPYMPLWYILSLQGSGFSNSIEASNYFFETGYFSAVDPAFMFSFGPGW